MDPGRVHATGNEIYSYKAAQHHLYDPIFSDIGALILNWVFANNGIRIASNGTQRLFLMLMISKSNTHGLGGYFLVANPRTCKGGYHGFEHEVGIKYKQYVMGKDHGEGYANTQYTEVNWAANYAIFVSNTGFPFNLSSTLSVDMPAIHIGK